MEKAFSNAGFSHADAALENAGSALFKRSWT